MNAYTNSRSSIDRRTFIYLIGITSLSWKSTLFAQSKQSALSIKRYTASNQGFYSNSYIIKGEESTTLVDAQLTKKDAQQIVEIINLTDKPLESVIITHGHTDHYAGLEIIGPAFAEATIYSAEETIHQIVESSSYWSNFSNKLAVLQTARYEFSNIVMDCLLLPDSESISPLVLYLPDDEILISGDHVLQNQHLWLAEGRSEQWLSNLDTLEEKWNIQQVFPGHGKPGGPELLDAVRQYIHNFQDVVNTSKNINIAKLKLLNNYPNHRLMDVLDISLASAFATKKP